MRLPLVRSSDGVNDGLATAPETWSCCLDMESTITEIAPDIYRISTFHEGYKMQFNQFLVKDDEPVLIHTAFRRMFPITRDAVARVIDPAAVRWIGFSHFEPDECGALNEWFQVAPQAQAVCSS